MSGLARTAVVSLLLLVLPFSSGAEALDDCLAAYQGQLKIQTARSSELAGEVPRSPVYVDFEDGINISEAKALAEVAEALKIGKRKPSFSAEYSGPTVESGSEVVFSLDHGCEAASNGEKHCDIDLADSSNKVTFNGKFDPPLDDQAELVAKVKVKVLFVTTPVTVKCAICGKPCKIKTLLKTMEFETPPCPIGSFTNELSFKDVTDVPSIPGGVTVDGHMEVKRSDGSVASEVDFKVST